MVAPEASVSLASKFDVVDHATLRVRKSVTDIAFLHVSTRSSAATHVAPRPIRSRAENRVAGRREWCLITISLAVRHRHQVCQLRVGISHHMQFI